MSAQGDQIRAAATKADECIARTRKAWEDFGTALNAIETDAKKVTADLRTIATAVDPLVPPTQTQPQPTPTPGWTDVFRDDFSGTALDLTKWVYEGELMNVKPAGTQQLDGPNLARNVSVSNGELVIQAKRETYTTPKSTLTYSWTGGGVQSRDAVLTIGTRVVFDHRAEVCSGMSPGWWSSSQQDDGEFDVPEMFGNAADIRTSCFRYAGFKTYSPMVVNKYSYIPADDKPHRSICWWKPDNSVEFTLDGKVVHTIPASYGLPKTPHRLRVTLQVGGDTRWRGAIPTNVNLYRCWTSSVAVQKPA